jgi:cytochrome c biogenesis protein CcdA
MLLRFNTQAEDAARFYTWISPNSKILSIARGTRNPAADAPHAPHPPQYTRHHVRLAASTRATGNRVMNDQQRKLWGKVLLAIGAVFFLLSTPCLLGGVLGLLGVLADAGPTENQQMGHQILRMALYPMGLGLLVLAAGLLVLRSRPK